MKALKIKTDKAAKTAKYISFISIYKSIIKFNAKTPAENLKSP